MPFRSAQADRWPEAFTPIGNRPLRALARRASAFADAKDAFSVGAGRSLAGGFHADWKSASPGAARRALAFADAKDAFSVGAGRSLAEGLHAD
jgi:hypothetical protein